MTLHPPIYRLKITVTCQALAHILLYQLKKILNIAFKLVLLHFKQILFIKTELFHLLKDGCKFGLFFICSFCTTLAAFQAYSCIIVLFYSCMNGKNGEGEVIDILTKFTLVIQFVGSSLFLCFTATTVNSCYENFKSIIPPLR